MTEPSRALLALKPSRLGIGVTTAALVALASAGTGLLVSHGTKQLSERHDRTHAARPAPATSPASAPVLVDRAPGTFRLPPPTGRTVVALPAPLGPTGGGPVLLPPVLTPPVTTPPVVSPPDLPPVVEPPVVEPPVVVPPVVGPPVVEPPVWQPHVQRPAAHGGKTAEPAKAAKPSKAHKAHKPHPAHPDHADHPAPHGKTHDDHGTEQATAADDNGKHAGQAQHTG